MPEESELLRRVNQAMSGTIQEQLRALVEDARAGMEQFSEAATLQGNLLAEAQATMADAQMKLERSLTEARGELSSDFRGAIEGITTARDADRVAFDAQISELGRRVGDMGSSVNDSIEVVRAEIESFVARSDQLTAEAIKALRTDVDSKIEMLGAQFQNESLRLRAEMAARSDEMSGSMQASNQRMDERQRALESRIEFLERSIEGLRARFEESSSESARQFEHIMARLNDTSGIEERAAKQLVILLSHALGTIDTAPAPAETDPMPETLSA